MDQLQFRRLDLNLLYSFDALLRERNVSRAAEAIGVSQSVMSAALGRLRRHYGDELLVRHRGQYDLTPLARQLRPALVDAVQGLGRVVSARTTFDPESAQEFTVVCGEVVGALLLPGLRRRMAEDAPLTTLRILDPHGSRRDHQAAESLLESVDGVFLPHGWVSGMESIDVLEDQWVFAVAASDPTARLTIDDLDRRPWLVATVGDGDLVRGMHQVLAAGVRPRIDVRVAGSMAMPFFLRGTDRVAVVGRRLIEEFGDAMGVREIPGPFELEALKTAFWWHPSRHEDPSHAWFRSLVSDLS
ncbi:LysR family transcriptional regulator [Aeromicrobium sp. Root472D3]|uniref:LysR family transcriptional regulator n=1 Tax=Aeromicrobium sp. Root472D3 TaxID=1736540 RepID=UPI0009E7065D|nr:LysR family transcriptional regulator [Aeromicrobium sp. Root472D3]